MSSRTARATQRNPRKKNSKKKKKEEERKKRKVRKKCQLSEQNIYIANDKKKKKYLEKAKYSDLFCDPNTYRDERGESLSLGIATYRDPVSKTNKAVMVIHTFNPKTPLQRQVAL